MSPPHRDSSCAAPPARRQRPRRLRLQHLRPAAPACPAPAAPTQVVAVSGRVMQRSEGSWNRGATHPDRDHRVITQDVHQSIYLPHKSSAITLAVPSYLARRVMVVALRPLSDSSCVAIRQVRHAKRQLMKFSTPCSPPQHRDACVGAPRPERSDQFLSRQAAAGCGQKSREKPGRLR